MQDTGLHGGFTKEGCTLKEQAVTQTNAVCNAEFCVHYKKYRLVQILEQYHPNTGTNTTTNTTRVKLQIPH